MYRPRSIVPWWRIYFVVLSLIDIGMKFKKRVVVNTKLRHTDKVCGELKNMKDILKLKRFMRGMKVFGTNTGDGQLLTISNRDLVLALIELYVGGLTLIVG